MKIENGNPKKVGRKYPGLEKPFHYRNVEVDLDGWADPEKYLPADFDLVLLQIQGRQNPIAGWISGTQWEGARMKEKDKVVRWKRKREFVSEHEDD